MKLTKDSKALNLVIQFWQFTVGGKCFIRLVSKFSVSSRRLIKRNLVLKDISTDSINIHKSYNSFNDKLVNLSKFFFKYFRANFLLKLNPERAFFIEILHLPKLFHIYSAQHVINQ